MFHRAIAFLALTAAAGLAVADIDPSKGLAETDIELKSAGPLAFGPGGVLFVADPMAATVYAIDTSEGKSVESGDRPAVEGLNQKVAALLGTMAGNVQFKDVAVNPATGVTYLSVSSGVGPKAVATLLKVSRKGEVSDVPLKKVKAAKATLANASEKKRADAITDMAFVNGRLLVAGLSNEEFASNLRAIPYPFTKVDGGSSIEIYHGAHGAFETRSPIRVFTTYKVGGEDTILAAYTCTPLVRMPAKALEPGKKVKAVTVAELGNRNNPQSIIIYNKGGKNFALMSNSARGLMKIGLDGIDKIEGITAKVKDKAGLEYETVEGMNGVQKLDAYGKEHALILVKAGERVDLKTIDLP